MNKFSCKRCGACCKPGWLVNQNAGRPHTLIEKAKSKLTGKPLPSRVVFINYTRWFEEDIARAASFLGISFDEFVLKYQLEDDTSNMAKRKGLTKNQHIEKEANDRGITIEELKRDFPEFRSYQLYTHLPPHVDFPSGYNRNCPFVEESEDGKHICGIYEARPDMCREYPSEKQLQKNFEFYAPHCPGFEKE